MATPEILVTGASVGRQGATGNHVTRMLLERGVPVRALVHRDDERSNKHPGDRSFQKTHGMDF